MNTVDLEHVCVLTMDLDDKTAVDASGTAVASEVGDDDTCERMAEPEHV